MYQIEKPHSGYCLSLECKTQMFVYALLLPNNELETTPFVNNYYIKFVLAKYYKDSKMTAYISERSRNLK